MDKIITLLVPLAEQWPTIAAAIAIYLFLKKDIGNIEKLFDRDRTNLNEKIGRIDSQLSNHITETNKKIEKLTEGQAKLEAKISEGQAELYKLLSLKSPDKKQ